LLSSTVFVLPEHNNLQQIAMDFRGANLMALDAGKTWAFWLSMAGIVTAWVCVAYIPSLSTMFKTRFAWLYNILIKKYGLDDFNQIVFVHGLRDAGQLFYDVSDVKVIDGICVNGSGRMVRWFAQFARRMQTGFLYQYALVMILGMLGFLIWFVGGF
jgi:NADH-quinone oxidoreductase subunit L